MRGLFCCLCLVLPISVVAAAQKPEPGGETEVPADAPVVVRQYFKASEYQSKLSIDTIRNEIQRNVQIIKKGYDDQGDARKINEKFKERIAQIQDMEAYTPFIQAAKGAVGLSPSSIKIRQRISETEALVEMPCFAGWASSPFVGSDLKTSLETKLMYLKGINFSNLVDGDSFNSKSILHVSGTRTYTTPLGTSNTVYVIEPIGKENEQAIGEILVARREANEAKDAEASKPKESQYAFREWADVTGKYRQVGRYVKCENAKITLSLPGGKTVEVPLDKLSEDDQKYVDEIVAASLTKSE